MLDSRVNEILGRNLRQYRESTGKSRQVFASYFDGSPFTLQGYESGKKCPNFQRFVHICNSLQISPNTLLDGLFPWETEIDTIAQLDGLVRPLKGAAGQRIFGMQELYLKHALAVNPKITGSSFGTRLHLLRLDAGLDVDALAKHCMVARSTFQGYESGQYDPGLPIVLRLCEVFHLSPEYLLAPVLKKLSYTDPRMVDLRPTQIQFLYELSKYAVSNLCI